MDFWARLDEIRERWNALHHPLYERWSQGDLTREQLAFYAGQYRHAVVALVRRLVAEGALGRKAGRGLYDYG